MGHKWGKLCELSRTLQEYPQPGSPENRALWTVVEYGEKIKLNQWYYDKKSVITENSAMQAFLSVKWGINGAKTKESVLSIPVLLPVL